MLTSRSPVQRVLVPHWDMHLFTVWEIRNFLRYLFRVLVNIMNAPLQRGPKAVEQLMTMSYNDVNDTGSNNPRHLLAARRK